MDFSNLSAIQIRLKMKKLGWDSHDRINKGGWINGHAYSIWFERYDWHGRRTILLTGRSVIFSNHTNDYGEIDEATRLCAEKALKAYDEFTDSIPYVNANGETVEDIILGDWNDPKAIINN